MFGLTPLFGPRDFPERFTESIGLDFDFTPFEDEEERSIAEVISAVTERGVSKVSIFGYSHGGGATYVLADRMTADMPAGAMYTIPFTGYIDGVAKRSSLAETRPPPNSDAHYNVWQQHIGEEVGLRFIQGGPVAGSFVNDNVDEAGGEFHYMGDDERMHTNILKRGIAETSAIISHFLGEFKEKVDR